MASSSPQVHTSKSFKGLDSKNVGLDSKKSHAWWWESHMGPRNSKWLAENLDVMDHNHKHMLKLIEGEGDSLAKKAEMYYQRRPELISHVEDFFRTYKSLAERYEQLSGEVRKHFLHELQTQGSLGFDSGSEATFASPSQDPKIFHPTYGTRAAGFDFFLGSKRSGLSQSAKWDDTSSITDSETESDVSSLQSYPGISISTGEDTPQSVRPYVEDKFQVHQQENTNGSLRSENYDDLYSKIVGYEEELKIANEQIRQSEEEIADLKLLLHKSASSEPGSLLLEFSAEADDSNAVDKEVEIDEEKVLELQDNSSTIDIDVPQPEEKIRALSEELRMVKGRLHALDKEVIHLRKENRESSENIRKMQDLLKMSQKEAVTWKAKVETEKRQASKLQERIARYKTSLNDRENEVRELKEVISDANRKYQLHAEITRLTDEKTRLEERLREWEMQYHSLETQHGALERNLNDEIEHLKEEITEKSGRLEVLEHDLDACKSKIDSLSSERDQLSAELSGKEDQIINMEKHLDQIVTESEAAKKRAEELTEEAERQKVFVLETAEGKREAIRQLCFSLEHYRISYQQLRHAFTGHKQLQVLAS